MSDKKLKFYIDLELLEYYSPPNCPFYDNLCYYFFYSFLPLPYKIAFFHNMDELCRKIFKGMLDIHEQYVTNIEECDYVLLIPQHLYDYEKVFKLNQKLSDKAKRHGKTAVLFDTVDFYKDLPNDNCVKFVADSYYSKDKKGTYGHPILTADYFDGNILKKKLSIGFCGYLHNAPSDWHVSKFRHKIINNLSQYKCTNFIITNSWGDIPAFAEGGPKRGNKIVPHASVEQYRKNIKNNLYTVCVRGGGNFSFRLGETFMMGRIPILIDSDCNFPFRDEIPYHTNTVYVTVENSNNFENIMELVENFHNSHTEKELMAIQRENRKIWEEYFTFEKIFQKTYDLLVKLKEEKIVKS